jgi:hypothetical protein
MTEPLPIGLVAIRPLPIRPLLTSQLLVRPVHHRFPGATRE